MMDIVDKYQLLERFSEIQRDFSIISHRGHFHLDRVKDSEFYYKRSGDFLTVYDVHKNRSFSFNIIPKVNKGTKIFHLVIPE